MKTKIHTPKQSNIEIVEFLSKSITKKYSQLEIAKAIRKESSYKNVRESIKELVKNEIISTEEVGNYVRCSLNIDGPKTIDYLFFIESSKKYALFEKAPLAKEISQRLIQQIRLHTPFFTMILFGSYAKGTFHENSDIDLIIIAEKKHHAAVDKEIASLQAIYTIKLNPLVMTQKDYESMLLSKEEINVGKESLKSHILLFGTETYYQIVRDAYGKG